MTKQEFENQRIEIHPETWKCHIELVNMQLINMVSPVLNLSISFRFRSTKFIFFRKSWAVSIWNCSVRKRENTFVGTHISDIVTNYLHWFFKYF